MASVFTLKNIAQTTTLFDVDDSGNVTAAGTISTTGTDDFGALGIKADIIAESTAGAGVTIDGLLLKDESIDMAGSAVATGDSNLILKANLADALSIKDSTGDMVVYTTTTATPGIAETMARTGAGTAHSVAATVNSASAAVVALAGSAAQITTARTSGTMTAVKGSVTSLTGDTAGVDYYAFEAAVTVGEANADHLALRVGAGFDAAIDSSAAATGETDWIVGDNLADALTIREGANAYVTLVSTNSSEKVQVLKTLDLDAALLDISTQATDLEIIDNSATALNIKQGANSYLKFVSTDSAEFVVPGKTLKPAAGLSAYMDLSGNATGESDIVVADNLASAWEIRESANTLIKIATTNTLETIFTGSGGTVVPVATSMARAAMADADATLSDAQHRGAIISMTPGATRTLTTRTAAQLVAAYPGVAVGHAFPLYVSNLAAAQDIALAGGAGVTLVGNGTIAGATQKAGSFLLVFTNVTGASEAADLVRVG